MQDEPKEFQGLSRSQLIALIKQERANNAVLSGKIARLKNVKTVLAKTSRKIAGMFKESAKDLTAVQELLDTDALTGTLSLRAGNVALCNMQNQIYRENILALQRDRGEISFIGLIHIDLDYFKEINDRLGHAGGNAALVHFANTTNENLRDGDMISRFGGDEFYIFSKISIPCKDLPQQNTVDFARQKAIHGTALFADRLRMALASSSFTYEGKPCSLTFSAGVDACLPEGEVVVPKPSKQPNTERRNRQVHLTHQKKTLKAEDLFCTRVLKGADEHLYCAKEKRNCVGYLSGSKKSAIFVSNMELNPVLKKTGSVPSNKITSELS